MTTLLIDGNNVLMSQHSDIFNLENGIVYNFLLQIIKQAKIVKPDRIIVAWDHGRSWRKEVSTEYKANRVKDNGSEWFAKLNDAREVLRKKALPGFGCHQLYAKTYEADDIAGFYSAISRNEPTVLYSNDKDWLVLVDENTSVLYKDRGLKSHVIVNVENFQDITSWPNPTVFLFAKCAMGDGSDNIAGLKGIGPITLRQYFAGETNSRKAARLKEFYDGSDLLKQNLKLMDIRAAFIDAPIIHIKPNETFSSGILELCREMGFIRLLSNKGNWLKNFRNLNANLSALQEFQDVSRMPGHEEVGEATG